MTEKSPFDKSLQKIQFAFRSTGLNLGTDGRKRNYKQNCVYLFNFLWLNTDIIGALSWLLEGIISGKNFTELTYVAPCLTLSILGDIKAFCLLLNERKVHNLIDNLRDLEAKSKNFENSEWDNIMQPEIKLFNIIIKVLNVLNCLMIVVFDVSPLILIAVKYFTTGELELLLPFLDVYPFDSFNLRYWPFAYIHQIWSGMCFCLLFRPFYFHSLCTYVIIHLEHC